MQENHQSSHICGVFSKWKSLSVNNTCRMFDACIQFHWPISLMSSSSAIRDVKQWFFSLVSPSSMLKMRVCKYFTGSTKWFVRQLSTYAKPSSPVHHNLQPVVRGGPAVNWRMRVHDVEGILTKSSANNRSTAVVCHLPLSWNSSADLSLTHTISHTSHPCC